MKIRPHIHVQYTTVIYINLDIQKEVYDSHLIHSYSHQLPSPFPKQSTILIPHHLIIGLDSIRPEVIKYIKFLQLYIASNVHAINPPRNTGKQT